MWVDREEAIKQRGATPSSPKDECGREAAHRSVGRIRG